VSKPGGRARGRKSRTSKVVPLSLGWKSRDRHLAASRVVRKLLSAAVLSVVALALLPGYVGAFTLSGASLAPTLLLGDRLLANRAACDKSGIFRSSRFSLAIPNPPDYFDRGIFSSAQTKRSATVLRYCFTLTGGGRSDTTRQERCAHEPALDGPT
jgi:hypothetical protein